MASMKEIAIREYLANVDFKSDWSYEQIEQDLKTRVGERPSLDVKYKRDVMILEGSKKAKEIKVLEKVSIIYTDLDNRIKKIEILID